MNDLKPFRYWCQKVLPLVYDDSLSYYELLCKVIDYLNKTMENVNILSENFDELQTAFNTLKNYVENYFNNLDVQEEINKKLDEMAKSGELTLLFQKYFNFYVTPQMYGAKGDGISDDTSFIQSALDSGKAVIFPSGIYLVSKTIEITDDKTVIGCGLTNTTITSNGGASIFNITGKNNLVKNIGIKGRINTSVLTKPSYGINLAYNGGGEDSRNTLSNVEIYYFATGVSMTNNTRSCVLNDCKISWCDKAINCVGTDNNFNNILVSFCKNGITLYNNNLLTNSKCFEISLTALSLTGSRNMVCNFDLQEFYVGLYVVGNNNSINNLSISHAGTYYNFETSKPATDHTGLLMTIDGSYNRIDYSYDSTDTYYIDTLIRGSGLHNYINGVVNDKLAKNIYTSNTLNWQYNNDIIYNNFNVNYNILLQTINALATEITLPYSLKKVVIRSTEVQTDNSMIYYFENVPLHTTFLTMVGTTKVKVNDNKISILQKSHELNKLDIFYLD